MAAKAKDKAASCVSFFCCWQTAAASLIGFVFNFAAGPLKSLAGNATRALSRSVTSTKEKTQERRNEKLVAPAANKWMRDAVCRARATLTCICAAQGAMRMEPAGVGWPEIDVARFVTVKAACQLRKKIHTPLARALRTQKIHKMQHRQHPPNPPSSWLMRDHFYFSIFLIWFRPVLAPSRHQSRAGRFKLNFLSLARSKHIFLFGRWCKRWRVLRGVTLLSATETGF